MIALKDIYTGRYLKISGKIPVLVDLRDADRFATRMDAGIAMLHLPLSIMVAPVEATAEAACDTCAEYGEMCSRHGSERNHG